MDVQTAQPQGVLKVTAPGWFANRTFADLPVAYQTRYPSVLVDLRLENRFVDLVEEGYDMAIRATSEPSLIVRPLCKMPFVLAGSRAYLERHGPLRHPDDIARHRLVLPTYTNIETVTLTGPDGAFLVRNQAALKTNDTSMALQLVRASMGLAYFSAWIVDPEFAAGTLVRVLPAPSVYAVYTSRKYMTTKVRTFIDFLSETLGEHAS